MNGKTEEIKRGILGGLIGRYFDKTEIRNLLYIGLAGFVLRFVYVLETQGTPFFNYLFSDSEIYNKWAVDILENGDWIGSEVFFMAPPYPYIIALIYLIIGQSLFFVRFLQVIVSTLNIFVIYLIGRNVHSKKAGYVSAIVASLYSLFVFYGGAVLSETFQTFVVSLLVYYISKNPDNFQPKYWFRLGLILGISALFRANLLLYLFVLAIWFLFKYYGSPKIRKVILHSLVFMMLGASVPILPVTLRNYLVEEDLVLLTSNGGINFFLGNNEKGVGVFLSPKEFDFYNDLSGEKYVESKLGYKIKPSDASSYWYERSFDFFADKPFQAVMLNVKKLLMFFSGEEFPQSTVMDIDYFRDNYSKVLKLPLVNYYLISVLGLLGFIIYLGLRKRNNMLVLFLISYVIGTSIFFISGRFRLAIAPLLIVFASYALIRIWDAFAEKKFGFLKLPVIIVLLFIFVDSFILAKPKYNYHDAYLHLGDIAYKEGNYDEAIELFNRSLFYQDSYVSYVNIGNAFAVKRDFRNAISSYNKAIARNAQFPLAYFNLGFAYTQIGDFPKAEESYMRVIELDPGFEGAYRNLGITYYVQERYDEALFYFEKFLQISKDEITKESVRQDIENIKRKLEN